jgi:hypothetical protein
VQPHILTALCKKTGTITEYIGKCRGDNLS